MELWVDVVTGRHSAGARRAAKRADLVNASTARSFPKQGPHQVSDDGGVARVVLGDARLHLAHQVRAHVGRLGVDAAAQLKSKLGPLPFRPNSMYDMRTCTLGERHLVPQMGTKWTCRARADNDSGK